MTVSPVPKAVVLFSGGLDSSTVVAMAQQQGFEVHALSFRYGQRHVVELQAAQAVAKTLGLRHHITVDVDLRAFGGSALTADLAVPKGAQAHPDQSGIPITYVPARNTVFLSYALAWAETLGSFDIFMGVNALDYSGYPDCRPEYIKAYERMANYICVTQLIACTITWNYMSDYIHITTLSCNYMLITWPLTSAVTRLIT